MRKSLTAALAIFLLSLAIHAYADTSMLYGKWALTGSFAGQSLEKPVYFEVGYDSTKVTKIDLNNSYDSQGNLQNYIYLSREFQDHTTYKYNNIKLFGEQWNTAARMDDTVLRMSALGYTYNGPYPVYQDYIQITMVFSDSNYNHADIYGTLYNYANQSYYQGNAYLDRLAN